MREFKFRAWHPVFKMMSDNVLELDFQNDVIRCLPGWPNNRLSNVVLMQFTGLHDKNGTEIYEGDILREDSSNLGKLGNIPVKFSNGAFLLDGKLLMDHALQNEVIGNVHENPDLAAGPQPPLIGNLARA
jgi:hypothetical protein